MRHLLKLFKCFLRLPNEITGQLFTLIRAYPQVQKRIKNLEHCKSPTGYPLFDLDVLLRHLKDEQGRRQIIEDKAKTNILGITLAFTVILATVAFAPRISAIGKDNPDGFIWAFMALQLYGIIFLIVGGWLALTALRVAKNYIWTLEDERDNTTAEARNAEIAWYLQINQQVSVLKSNLLDASYACIRNGVAALAISAILVLVFLVIGL